MSTSTAESLIQTTFRTMIGWITLGHMNRVVQRIQRVDSSEMIHPSVATMPNRRAATAKLVHEFEETGMLDGQRCQELGIQFSH